MARFLVISEAPKTRAYLEFALKLMGIEIGSTSSLTMAALCLDRAEHSGVILDLRWPSPTAPSMTDWMQTHVQARGLRMILTSETPIARNIHCALRLGSAIVLGRAFDFDDVVEAVGHRGAAIAPKLVG
jgi:DNA-binding NtrC family response regulator